MYYLCKLVDHHDEILIVIPGCCVQAFSTDPPHVTMIDRPLGKSDSNPAIMVLHLVFPKQIELDKVLQEYT